VSNARRIITLGYLLVHI